LVLPADQPVDQRGSSPVVRPLDIARTSGLYVCCVAASMMRRTCRSNPRSRLPKREHAARLRRVVASQLLGLKGGPPGIMRATGNRRWTFLRCNGRCDHNAFGRKVPSISAISGAPKNRATHPVAAGEGHRPSHYELCHGRRRSVHCFR
jgi:hypothetical protein